VDEDVDMAVDNVEEEEEEEDDDDDEPVDDVGNTDVVIRARRELLVDKPSAGRCRLALVTDCDILR
jgi:hypothetical protein